MKRTRWILAKIPFTSPTICYVSQHVLGLFCVDGCTTEVCCKQIGGEVLIDVQSYEREVVEKVPENYIDIDVSRDKIWTNDCVSTPHIRSSFPMVVVGAMNNRTMNSQF